MPSLIPGYEYDIFISYRQKDNKGDRWVSEFVEALKTELESTFKEEISVYFDINPHDGLLETHDVDASLKEKLKCLVFIPIFSRTYCDPKSFAWEHELKAFVEQASQDQFGLKVKLPNGNVANRVLPVRIHDLDNDDIKLCESVLGGVIRGIEFIYKEPGVNKPLTADDDEKKNLNSTKYRIQINKVSLAIKEIITALGQHEQKPEAVQKEFSKPVSVPLKSNKIKIIAGSIIVLALIVLGYFLIPKLQELKGQVEKSIAVLPFRNDSPDEENQYFINGTMEAILDDLCKIEDLKVISRTSVEQYRNTTKSIPQIAKELNVSYILEGSGQKYGDDIKLTVQLIDAVNDKHIWSSPYNRKITDIYAIQSEIAQVIASELKAIITPEEKQKIEKIPTDNTEAYENYLLGLHYYNKGTEENLLRAIDYYKNAITNDPQFALAYTGISWAYMDLVFDANWSPEEVYPKAREAALKALELDNSLSEAHVALANIKFYNDWDFKAAEKEFEVAIGLNSNNPTAFSDYAHLLYVSCRFKEALDRIKQALVLDPNSEGLKFWSGFYLYQAFKTDTAIAILKKGVEKDPANAGRHYILGYIYLQNGDYIKSIQELEKAIELNPIPQPYYLYLGIAYSKAGKLDETKKILEKLDSLEKAGNKVSFGKALLLAELGDTEQSILLLEKGYEERHQYMLYLKCVPIMCSSIRSDPRFIEIYKKVWPDD
jgi:TolB-like protein/Flp pilus assembly protein TadD